MVMKLTKKMILQDDEYPIYLKINIGSKNPELHEKIKRQILENQDIVQSQQDIIDAQIKYNREAEKENEQLKKIVERLEARIQLEQECLGQMQFYDRHPSDEDILDALQEILNPKETDE